MSKSKSKPKIRIDYGLNDCYQLFDKLKYDGERLLKGHHPYDFFNFIVTAYHLLKDWIKNDYLKRPKYACKKVERSRQRYPEIDLLLNLIDDIANGSKHFYKKDPRLENIEICPPEIRSWSAYFRNQPMIYVSTNGYFFSSMTLHSIIMKYVAWIFDDDLGLEPPKDLLDLIKKCKIEDPKA